MRQGANGVSLSEAAACKWKFFRGRGVEVKNFKSLMMMHPLYLPLLGFTGEM
jgi:hypothetical protein